MTHDNAPPDWREDEALKRFEMIAPLLSPDLDPGARQGLRRRIADQNGLSAKTLKRYEQRYAKGGIKGLAPDERPSRGPEELPENFDQLLKEAIELRRELPSRSVSSIIRILELEGKVPAKTLKRSTLQRHMYQAGFGHEHMKQYIQIRESSIARRYCMPHRMMMLQADIKEGGKDVHVMVNGVSTKVYLSSVIDDHSRFILFSRFFDNESSLIVEDSFREAFTNYGKPKKVYVDRGSQYINRWLKKACAELGVPISYAPVRSGKSKGIIEKYHQVVDRFLSEVLLKGPVTLDELNRWWSLYLDEMYQNSPHSGISEYYKQNFNIDLPDGITPKQEWDRDTVKLEPFDPEAVRRAFLHNKTGCRVDEGSCVRFAGIKYKVPSVMIGHKVTVTFDPRDLSTIEIDDPGIPTYKESTSNRHLRCRNT